MKENKNIYHIISVITEIIEYISHHKCIWKENKNILSHHKCYEGKQEYISHRKCDQGEQEYVSHHKCYEGEKEYIYRIINVMKGNKNIYNTS